MKNEFDKWFYELERFSSRSEYFFLALDEYCCSFNDETKRLEKAKIILSWLEAAFEEGRKSGEKA